MGENKVIKFIRDKQTILLSVIVILMCLTVTLSYSYFMNTTAEPGNTDINAATGLTEYLSYTKGNEINIIAKESNFYEGAGSLTGETTTTVHYNAGSDNLPGTGLYHVYFNISKNTFNYTVDNSTPEILLTITNPDGNVVTTATKSTGEVINAVTKTTLVQDGSGGVISKTVTGFDITDFNGYIVVAEDYEIINSNSEVPTNHDWKAEVTYLNLDANQIANEGSVLDSNFLITINKMLTNNYMIDGATFRIKTSEYRGSSSLKTLHKIEFRNTINNELYENATDKWDVSFIGDESVVAYVVEENSQNVMYIEANGNIIANLDQSHFFRDFRDVTTIEFNNVYNTRSVIDMSYMFNAMHSLKSLDVSSFNTSKVTDVSCMFLSLRSLTTLDISSFDTSKVTSMYGMFEGMTSLTTLNISNLNTSNVTDMSRMFYDASLTRLDLSSFNTSSVTDMNSMFSDMSALSILDINSFDTSQVNNMDSMFAYMYSITTLDLSHFDTSNVTNMDSMFSNMKSITALDLSNFITSNVTNMSDMFFYMPSLKTLDISSFDTSNVINMSFMFGASNLLTNPLYARTQADADKFNGRDTTNLTTNATFTVKP